MKTLLIALIAVAAVAIAATAEARPPRRLQIQSSHGSTTQLRFGPFGNLREVRQFQGGHVPPQQFRFQEFRFHHN